ALTHSRPLPSAEHLGEQQRQGPHVIDLRARQPLFCQGSDHPPPASRFRRAHYPRLRPFPSRSAIRPRPAALASSRERGGWAPRDRPFPNVPHCTPRNRSATVALPSLHERHSQPTRCPVRSPTNRIARCFWFRFRLVIVSCSRRFGSWPGFGGSGSS